MNRIKDYTELESRIVAWIREYADNNFIKALVVGVSGGIDSAVVSTLCARTGIRTYVLSMPLHSNSNIKVSTDKFDSVIATCSAPVFSRLIEKHSDLSNSYLNKLQKIEYMSAVMLILVINEPFTKYYWLNIADPSIPFVGIIEHTNLVSPALYSGKHILYITNYLTKEDRLYQLEHKDLLAEYIPHLSKINPEFDTDSIEDSYIHKVDYAQPIVGSNYSNVILDHTTPVKGLYLCNTTQVYPEDRGTNYSVRLGKKIATKVMENQ